MRRYASRLIQTGNAALPAQQARSEQHAHDGRQQHAKQIPNAPEWNAHLRAVQAVGQGRRGSRQ
ncbi:hypothetical protein [Pseudomonas sp. SA233]